MSAPQTVPAPVVLVVDDEPVVLRLMERTLASAGYQVYAATDGVRALVMAADARPDVLVTDMRMDPIDGADLAKMIVRERPIVRVLFVSGYDPEHLELSAPLLRKPFSPNQLLEAVEAVLSHSPRRSAAPGVSP